MSEVLHYKRGDFVQHVVIEEFERGWVSGTLYKGSVILYEVIWSSGDGSFYEADELEPWKPKAVGHRHYDEQ